MESLLDFSARHTQALLSTEITDVGGGGAILYVLNGSAHPPKPALGDFLYDLPKSTFNVYFQNGWMSVGTALKPRVWHPNGIQSTVAFTLGGLPFWRPSSLDEDERFYKTLFDSVDHLLRHFITTFDPDRLKLDLVTITHKRTLEEIGWSEEHDRQSKSHVILSSMKLIITAERPHTLQSPSKFHKARTQKDPHRFTSSTFGFPEGSESVVWHGQYTTFKPFAGKTCQTDEEGLLVNDLAQRPSLELSTPDSRCGPEPNAFQVGELVVELELDPILGEDYDGDVGPAWAGFLQKIGSYLAASTSVVIRASKRGLNKSFSKSSMEVEFGSLGNRCEWMDGVLLAENRDLDDHLRIPYHKRTTLETFVDLAGDPTTCGNFLDSKDVNPSPPHWMKPLLHSDTAWNQTMHLKFTQKPRPKAKARTGQTSESPPLNVTDSGPSVLRTATWTSQGWRLLTHPGSVTFPHHDCCGMCTYIIGDTGAKIWGVMRPKRDVCPDDLRELGKVFRTAAEMSPYGSFSNADIATVCLEKGDVMFQPPGVLHCVYTPVASIFSGGYFYHHNAMHLTRAVVSLNSLHQEAHLTNDDRPGFLRTLCRILIALRYQASPKTINKRSFLSLLLIVLDHRMDSKCLTGISHTTVLAEEERGEMAFAVKTAESLLEWMGITAQEARNLVRKVGPYYLAGDEAVMIPAVSKGGAPGIFPSMEGFM